MYLLFKYIYFLILENVRIFFIALFLRLLVPNKKTIVNTQNAVRQMKKANKPKLVYWSTYISSYLSKIYFSNSELMIRKNIQKQNYFVFVYSTY